LLVIYPNNPSFGMGLSTRASCLLHKCRENNTICSKASFAVVAVWYQMIP